MKSGWRGWLELQFARIDALSLRERAFLFLSVLAAGMALVDVLWLSPAQVAHQQLTQRFEKQNTELQRLRDALKSVARPVDKNQTLHSELADINQRLETVNQSLKEATLAPAQVTRLEQVLVQLLRRQEGLTLVLTSAVAPEAATTKAAQGAAAGGATTPPGLTRQGVELTVSGSYAELTRYVQTLETTLPNVRWGVMKLRSDKLPPQLTLQLFLVGVAP